MKAIFGNSCAKGCFILVGLFVLVIVVTTMGLGGLRAKFGAAEVQRSKVRAVRLPREQTTYERDVTAARAHLDEAAFAATWAEGQAMTLEQAIAYALSDET